jgi:hypothetical protein
MMELKDFIRESLTQIVDGALAAHEQMKEKGAAVNPVPMGQAAIITGAAIHIENVEFDVALTDAEKQATEGGLGSFWVALGSARKRRKGSRRHPLRVSGSRSPSGCHLVDRERASGDSRPGA